MRTTTDPNDVIDLRPWEEGDLPLLFGTMGDPDLTTYLGGVESEEKLRDRHRRYLALGSPDTGRMFVIVHGPDRVPAGTHGYWRIERDGAPAWETGWFVLSPFQGRGIATRATLLAAERAWTDAPGLPIHAFPTVENLASNAVCRKAGFRLVGPFAFEYPPGNPVTCNDWVLEPRSAGRPEGRA